MKTKLLIAVALLGVSLASSPASSAPQFCDTTYCVGRPSTAPCNCPTWTDKPGAPRTCGNWNTAGSGCWF
jgi:hypothetical protein